MSDCDDVYFQSSMTKLNIYLISNACCKSAPRIMCKFSAYQVHHSVAR